MLQRLAAAVVGVLPVSLLRREGREVGQLRPLPSAVDATLTRNATKVPCESGSEYWDPEQADVVPPCKPRPPQQTKFPNVGPKGKPREMKRTKVALVRSCETFYGTRLLSMSGNNEINNLQVSRSETIQYGEVKKNREQCIETCRILDLCQQAVWHKLTNACYLMTSVTMTEARMEMADEEFDSSICGARACRVFDNYRKGNSGVPIDRDPAQNHDRRQTLLWEPKVPPHLTTRPPHLDGFHPTHETPFKAHAFRVGSYSECEGWCLRTKECKQVVYDKMDKLCELWTGRSNGVDSDGWPGTNKLYKSAACGTRVCELYPDKRKDLPAKYKELRLDVVKGRKYGSSVQNWEDCLHHCLNDYHCLQTVFDKHTRKCFPMEVAVKAEIPVSYSEKTRYQSAHCFLSDESINAV